MTSLGNRIVDTGFMILNWSFGTHVPSQVNVSVFKLLYQFLPASPYVNSTTVSPATLGDKGLSRYECEK